MIKLPIPADYAEGKASYRAPLSIQLGQLMHRSWILAQREPRISRAKIAQTIIVAAFLIPTFWQLNKYTNCSGADETKCKQDNVVEFHSMVGAMYFLCVM